MNENGIVIKHNKLIEAKYDLNLNEQKIILYAVSKLDRNNSNFNILELEVKEFTKLIGTTTDRYSEIRELVRELRKKEVIIKLDDNNKQKELITGWLSSIEYKGDGIIELEFSQKLVPYLLQLKKFYTKYEIKNILYLKNKYSIRIYELLKQYQTIGKREFNLEELKDKLGCSNKFKEFRDFKRRILDPAKKEINELTDINFEYEKLTRGRKVIGIKFIIDYKIDKEKQIIDSLYSKEEIQDIKIKSGLENEKFSSKQILNIYKIAVKKTNSGELDPFEYIKLNYQEIIRKNTARNKFAYLKKALEEDFAGAANQIKYSFVFN
ncbi:replication initiation protein [Tepidibacter formicigenes]|jgi:plasmid replication initiation protein|uniref:Initiator Replication protein n=1 Tax=Tepidibacter formicigenes DSM 15518 TaxID=1123349 RepID=A0A1M6U6L6_9FIRM|nr:replication initiation protein [Tepidibacter formicigenes]SHK64718.1 Initiator Replication protein [Tepidibacter formicigenes DSM 15518]